MSLRSLNDVCADLDLGVNPNPVNMLPDAWTQFLMSYQWQWFVTLTFRDSTHPEAADKLFRVWVSRLNRLLLGNGYRRKPQSCIHWVRGLELQKRGVIHFHALMYSVEDLNVKLRRLDAMDDWAKLVSRTKHNPLPHELKGTARIETPESQENVSDYTAKYCVKDGQIDVSDNLPAKPRTQAQFFGSRSR